MSDLLRRSVRPGADYLLKTLQNGVDVLMLFTGRQPVLTLTEVVQALGLGKSRTFKIIETLVHAGLLMKRLRPSGYSLGPSSVQLGIAAARRMILPELAACVLEALTAQTGETSALTVQRLYGSLIVAKHDSAYEVRGAMPLGWVSPLYAGGSNVPLLAFGSPEVREEFLSGGVPLQRFTEQTADTPEKLASLLDMVRAQGYHLSDGELEPGMMAIGAPVVAADSELVYCVSVSGPSYRMAGRSGLIVQAVRLAAARLTELVRTGGVDAMD